MNVLVLNNGSSSLKAKVFGVKKNEILELVEFQFKMYNDDHIFVGRKTEKEILQIKLSQNHIKTININEYCLEYIQKEAYNLNIAIDSIIIRMVHGGSKYINPIKINNHIIKDLKNEISDLAPIHNPINLKLAQDAIQMFPNTDIYVVFDTSFFQNMPIENIIYGLPYEYYEKLKIHRYGFHGFSHRFISKTVQNLYKQKKDIKIISCHLGSGSSVCAIDYNKPIDTSFGFSPEENIISSTRCGEVDFSALNFIKNLEHLSDNDITNLINFKSGFLGISGYTKDMKTLLQDYQTNPRSKLCVDIYVIQVTKFIYQMLASLNGIDVLVFTGGIGCGSDIIREMIVKKLSFMGCTIDDTKNKNRIDVDSKIKISKTNSKFDIWIIPTNEEIEMVKEVFNENT